MVFESSASYPSWIITEWSDYVIHTVKLSLLN